MACAGNMMSCLHIISIPANSALQLLNRIVDCWLQEEVYLSRVAELDHITDVRNSQRRQHDDLRRRRLDEFMAGFSVITTRLKEMYQMITLGGDAELELVDSLDPFSEGIVFRYVHECKLPGRPWARFTKNLRICRKIILTLS